MAVSQLKVVWKHDFMMIFLIKCSCCFHFFGDFVELLIWDNFCVCVSNISDSHWWKEFKLILFSSADANMSWMVSWCGQLHVVLNEALSVHCWLKVVGEEGFPNLTFVQKSYCTPVSKFSHWMINRSLVSKTKDIQVYITVSTSAGKKMHTEPDIGKSGIRSG